MSLTKLFICAAMNPAIIAAYVVIFINQHDEIAVNERMSGRIAGSG